MVAFIRVELRSFYVRGTGDGWAGALPKGDCPRLKLSTNDDLTANSVVLADRSSEGFRLKVNTAPMIGEKVTLHVPG